ncbi:MAG: putative nucleic acid-binding protein containings domain [Candidatus Acidoferrum typicum]|nr:putative nucleic acid-binding protein containings domain [Candidatus Acidoferrum typicum]
MKLFVDTWGWVAVTDRSDPGHEAATEIFRRARRSGGTVTSNFILDETFTLLFKRRPFDDAWHFTTTVVRSPFIDVQEVTESRFFRTIELRKQFSDKPRISFTDLSTMALMVELRITDVLTADRHFSHVGLGFRTLP